MCKISYHEKLGWPELLLHCSCPIAMDYRRRQSSILLSTYYFAKNGVCRRVNLKKEQTSYSDLLDALGLSLKAFSNRISNKCFLLSFSYKFHAVTSSTTSSWKTYPYGMVISIVLTDTFIILGYHALIEFISNI